MPLLRTASIAASDLLLRRGRKSKFGPDASSTPMWSRHFFPFRRMSGKLCARISTPKSAALPTPPPKLHPEVLQLHGARRHVRSWHVATTFIPQQVILDFTFSY